MGYSAADDLKYRISFSHYLECVEESPVESVDFYGVNSYQWCGEQTFYSSGYNTLVDDYVSYTRPLFLSEYVFFSFSVPQHLGRVTNNDRYGCNEVTPRNFGEIPSLYSNDMVDVFSGGLVYQFTQESNNYGLVELQQTGDVKLLPDYFALKQQLDSLPDLDYYHISQSMKQNAKEAQNRNRVLKSSLPICETTYENIDISKGLPQTIATDLIEYGVEVQRGSFIPLSDEQFTCKYLIFDDNDQEYQGTKKIQMEIDYMSGIGLDKLRRIKGYKSGTYNDRKHQQKLDQDSDYDSEYSYSDDSEEFDHDETLLAKASVYFKQLFNSIAALFSTQ